MSRVGAESRENRASDSLLVRIAEKPLVVAALFLFTAIFPWVIYFLAPIIAKASVLDLLQWLSLPVLFLTVNGVLFFQWINHSSGGSGSIGQGDLEVYQLPKRPSIEIGFPEDSFLDKAAPKEEASASLLGEEASASWRTPTEKLVQDEDQEHKLKSHFSSCSSCSSSDSEPEVGEEDSHAKMPEVHVEDRDVQPPTKATGSGKLPPRPATAEERRGHKKSESLNLKVELPELVDFREKNSSPEKTPSPEKNPSPEKTRSAVKPTSKVTRRNSSPKSKTPKPTSQGLVNGSKVTRRNSSPKSVTPTAVTFMKYHEAERSAPVHGEESFNPQLRSIQEAPLPLDKDDLNDKIEKFLTDFKIKRQESNLRAALTSIGQ